MKKTALLILSILFTISGLYSMASEEVTVGGKTFIFYKKDLLHYSGSYTDKIWRGNLAKDTTVNIGVNTITFKKNSELAFYASGEIGSGYPAVDTELKIGNNKIKARAGKRILFFKPGNIQELYLAGDTVFTIGQNTVTFKKGVKEIEMMQFFENGEIRRGYLNKQAVCKAGKYSFTLFNVLIFYKNGSVEAGHLHKNTVFKVKNDDIIFIGSEYHMVEFHKNGAVHQGYIHESKTINIDGNNVKFQYRIYFNENGTVKMGVLAESLAIMNKKFEAHNTLTFKYDNRGKLIRIEKYRYPQR